MPLVIAGNRDEFHARPTQAAGWWPDRPDVWGGRDLQAGGTWLALHRNGRYAALTNHRDADQPKGRLRSRGALITDFLDGALAPLEFLDTVDTGRYAGFNLFVGDRETLGYLSNRGGGCRELGAGVHAVANGTLDARWPKVERTRRGLLALFDSGKVNETSLLRLLGDRQRARVEDIETGSLPFETAHSLSAPFVVMPEYGTRSSTVILGDRDGRTRMSERRYAPDGTPQGRDDFTFRVAQPEPTDER